MYLKDIFALVISGIALVLSLITLLSARRDRTTDERRTLRHELTEIVSKLNSVFEQSAALRRDEAGTLHHPRVVAFRSFLNGQKLFYARQAISLIQAIPSLATETDYNSIARAFQDNNETDAAEYFYRQAIDSSVTPRFRAMNYRALAPLLFQVNRPDEAREAYRTAIKLIDAPTDSDRWFRAETYNRWAVAEREAGHPEEFNRAAELAYAAYGEIQAATMRRAGIANFEESIEV